MIKKFLCLTAAVSLFTIFGGTVFASEVGVSSSQAEFLNDIAIRLEGVNDDDVVIGKTVRIYATVYNQSDADQKGVVRFYNERLGQYVGTDQPFSAVAGGSDTVFIDLLVTEFGDNPIAIRVLPEDEAGDNPENNKITSQLYVDRDSDEDGAGNRRDPDDDNDGAPDAEDAFPFDPAESADTDGDGIGNNRDADDDADGVSDVEDAFPTDAAESVDRDGDGAGDNGDPFPNDPGESRDADRDGVGDNADTNDENHGPVIKVSVGGGSGRSHRPVDNGQQDEAAPETGATTTIPAASGTAARTEFAPNEPFTVYKGKMVALNALESYDPDGKIVKAEWMFANGQRQEGVIIDHRFEETGSQRVILKLTDDRGESRETALEVNVRRFRWSTLGWLAGLLLLLLAAAGVRAATLKKGLRRKKK